MVILQAATAFQNLFLWGSKTVITSCLQGSRVLVLETRVSCLARGGNQYSRCLCDVNFKCRTLHDLSLFLVMPKEPIIELSEAGGSGESVQSERTESTCPVRDGRTLECRTLHDLSLFLVMPKEPIIELSEAGGSGESVQSERTESTCPVRDGRTLEVQSERTESTCPVRDGRTLEVQSERTESTCPVRDGRTLECRTLHDLSIFLVMPKEPIIELSEAGGSGESVQSERTESTCPVRDGRTLECHTLHDLSLFLVMPKEPIIKLSEAGGSGESVQSERTESTCPVRDGRTLEVQSERTESTCPVRDGRTLEVQSERTESTCPVRDGRTLEVVCCLSAAKYHGVPFPARISAEPGLRSAPPSIPSLLAAECRLQFASMWRGVQYTRNRLPRGWKHSPSISHGLIQSVLGMGDAPDRLQCIHDIIVWGTEAEEVFEKGKRIVQNVLKAGFAIKKSKVKGPAWDIQFLGVKWQDGRCHVPMDVVKKIGTMSSPAKKMETPSFVGCLGFWIMCIPGYSQLVRPLYQVTRKKNHSERGLEQQQAFEQIKEEIACAVALGPVQTARALQNILYTAAR
ncbi:uncharacterized protein LOC135289121 isoform X2 [Passer domesticus]|uniref:uncharacterized protein LOC135289121 isoform X2 n=1 Tax=Passer domesticus TaxID=48849 RepID=UPI0030FE413D